MMLFHIKFNVNVLPPNEMSSIEGWSLHISTKESNLNLKFVTLKL